MKKIFLILFLIFPSIAFGLDGVLADLQREDVLELYHDYRSGVFYDWSGEGNSGTSSDAEWSGGHPSKIKFPETTSVITVADAAELQLTEGTLVVVGEFFSQEDDERLVCKRDAGGTNYDFYLFDNAGSKELRFFDGTNTRTLATDIRSKKYVAINFTNGETPEGFVDGSSVGNFNNTVAVSTDDADLQIGNDHTPANPLQSSIKAVVIVNRELTVGEHSDLYDELVSRVWPSKEKGKGWLNTSCNSNLPGIVGGYDMKPVGGVIPDLSGNGNDGTPLGTGFSHTPIGGAMQCDGVSGYGDFGAGFNSLTDVTVSFWFNCANTAAFQWVFNRYFSTADQWGVQINGNNFAILDDIDNIDVLRYATTISSNKWYHVVVQMDNLENILYLNGELVGSGESSPDDWSSFAGGTYLCRQRPGWFFFVGEIVNLRIYDDVKDQTWVTKMYQKGLKAVEYKTDWGVQESVAIEGGTTGNYLDKTPWRFGDAVGRWKVSTDTIDGKVVKVIENTTAGLLYMESDKFPATKPEGLAYGSWTFWFSKDNTSLIEICVICEDPNVAANGYGLRSYFGGNNYLAEWGVSNKVAVGNTPGDTWARIDITRDYDGQFYAYKDGVEYGPTNDVTVTTSKYFVLSFNPGDKFAYSDLAGNSSLVKRVGVVAP